MKLIVPIEPARADVRVLCIVCGRWGATHCDLAGEPFRAFYHVECASLFPQHVITQAAAFERRATRGL